MSHTPHMGQEISFKVSQPRFGSPQEGSEAGKVHLQARIEGRDYLSLVCWNQEPWKWSWHFYNGKLDRRFQELDSDARAALLLKFGKDSRGALPESLLKAIRKELKKDPDLTIPLPLEEETPAVEVSMSDERSVTKDVAVVQEQEEGGLWGGHNLIGYFEEINAQYFEHSVSVPVRWTKKYHKSYHYGMTFGFYDFDAHEICLNSRLNQKWVPDFFIRMVLYHEMLHVVVKPKVINGQTWHHHKEFRQRERMFVDFKKAVLWQRENLRKLMKRPKSKNPEEN